MKKTAVFDDLEREILTLLGFRENGDIAVKDFLRRILIENRPEDLHEKGISFRSIKEMLRKIEPEDDLLKKKPVKDFLNDVEPLNFFDNGGRIFD